MKDFVMLLPAIPNFLQWLAFIVGIAGFVLTLLTFLAANRLKKRIINNAEYNNFKDSFSTISDRLSSFVNSITEDQIYTKDQGRTFKPTVSQYLTDLNGQYTFFPSKVKRTIKEIQQLLNNPNLTEDDWNKVASQLTNLKNLLSKEDIYHG